MAMQPEGEKSDAELLIASQSNPEAFCELYDRWAGRLLAFFYRRVGDPDIAADLMAETVANLFEKRDRFRDQGQPGSAWIFTVAARQLSRYRRRDVVERRAINKLGWTIPALDSESVAALEALVDSDERAGPLSVNVR
jgi:DNA-directed RNA polymerase specialized sigma24 family protein